jgi:hypothetical protein
MGLVDIGKDLSRPSCVYVRLYPLLLLVTHFNITDTSQPYAVIGHYLALSGLPQTPHWEGFWEGKRGGCVWTVSAWKPKGGEFLFLARDCGSRMGPGSLALVLSPIRCLSLSKRRLGCRIPASFGATAHL